MKTRPSELLALTDPYVAYCLDEAVVHFGETVEGILHGISHKNQKLQDRMRTNKLHAILGTETSVGQKFARPAATK